ncbi:MAG: adenylate/guanylate cyclase domain-containing protein [Planctomycetaceae bacterium]
MKLDRLLGENDLTNLAFSIIERFSTQRSLSSLLTETFALIGSSVQLWAGSNSIAHVFVNPQLGQSHKLICRRSSALGASHCSVAYEEISGTLPIVNFKAPKSNHWQARCVQPDNKDDLALLATADAESCSRENSPWICQFDLANCAPLGQFVVVWRSKPRISASELFHIQEVLWNVARVVATVLCSHYPIHPTTYLPSFQLEGEKATAIVFADIRNSTPFFEIARLGGESQMMRVEVLLRAWFQYSADLIAARGLGNLHRFTGDGLVATFGEYAIPSETVGPDETGCLLALHAAKYLVTAFEEIHDEWRAHKSVSRFLREHNEDVDLRLGVGINYGNVRFSYIGRPAGSAATRRGLGGNSAGHLEYCAFGDHMNTTARLADCASRYAAELDLRSRGKRFRDDFRVAPIVCSHTAVTRISRMLNEKEESVHERKGQVRLRGKDHVVSFFEIKMPDINDLSCADILTNVASGHYSECMRHPPSRNEHVKALREDLDRLSG